MFRKKHFAKALAVILIIQLCFTLGIDTFQMPAKAAEKNLFSDDFNNGQSDGWTFSGGGGFAGVDGDHISIQRSSASSGAAATRQIDSSTVAQGLVSIEFKYKMVGNTGKFGQVTINGSKADGTTASAATLQLRENAGIYMRKIRGNTTYYRLGSTNCATNVEYDMKVQINTITQKVNIWVDGEQALTDGDTPNDVTKIISLNWQIAADNSPQNYYIDDVKVSIVFSDQEAVDSDYNWLDLGDISKVSENLNLPVSGPTGTSISWASNNEAVIAPDGTVIRGDTECSVTLTATIVSGAVSRQKVFQVTVLKDIPIVSDFEWIHQDQFSEPNLPTGWTGNGNKIVDEQLKLTRLSGDGSVSASRKINAGDQVVRGMVDVEFKFAMAGGANKYVQFQVKGRNMSNIDVNPVTIQFRENSGLYMKYKQSDPNTYYKIGTCTAATNEEHTIKIVTNTFTNKVNIWIDGEKALTDGDVGQEAVMVTSLYWTVATDNFPAAICLDDVKIGMQENYGDTVNADYELINIENADKITDDFTLPLTGMFGSDISWLSDNSNFVRVEGPKAIVTRPDSDDQNVNVLLTATVSRDVYFSKQKSFALTVLRKLTLEEMVDEDCNSLDTSMLLGQNKNETSILTDLILPGTGRNNTTISWHSSDDDIIKVDGQYGRVSGNLIAGPYEDVDLTATVQKEGYTASKNFTLRVLNPGYISVSKDKNVKVSSELESNEGRMAVDENANTFWLAQDGDKNPELQVDLGYITAINCISLQEKNSIVSGFMIQYSNNGQNWETVVEAGSPGAGQETTYTFSQVMARYVRYRVTSKGAGQTGLYDIKVFKRYSDRTCVEEDAANIDLGNTDEVTANLTLPTAGLNQTVITWESSNPSVVNNRGEVTRSDDTKQVVLTATVMKGSEKLDLSIPITVPGTGNGKGNGTGGGHYVGPQRSSGGGGISIVPTVQENPETAYTPFVDVPDSHWAKKYIDILQEKGVLSGTADGRVEPERIIKREEFIKLVCLSLGIVDPTASSNFADVKDSDWFYPYVSSAVKLGIVVGTGEDAFGVGQNITRQDMAVMIQRAAAASKHNLDNYREKSAFTDEGEISAYAIDSIYKLQEAGIIDGNGLGSFVPGAFATRAEAVKMICSLIGNQ